MSESANTSEIIDSLKEYVERQKQILEEDRNRLLNEGEVKFKKLLEEKQDEFLKTIEDAAARKLRHGRTLPTILRTFLHKTVRSLKSVKFKKQSSR